MAALLACHSYSFHVGASISRGRVVNDVSFLSVVTHTNTMPTKHHQLKSRKLSKFGVQMQHAEQPPKLGRYGREIKMIPASEARKRVAKTVSTPKIVNGSAKHVNGVDAVNGRSVSLVKRDRAPSLAKASTLPPVEGLKFIPSDEGYRWANENYNTVQRTIDVWSSAFLLYCRVRLDNAKWTYIGGFTKDKQITRRRRTASWLRERLLHLGPTLIDFDQSRSVTLNKIRSVS